jgi:hypothetical protein
MTADRRSPYIILGLPSGASLDDARREFDRRSQLVRRGNARGVTAEDLAWALAQVALHAAEPVNALDTYRIPLDTAALRPPAGPGLLRPGPRPTARTTGPTPQADREVVFDAARLDASRALLDRTAGGVGKQLDRIGDAPLPPIRLAEQPARRRSLVSVLLVAAVAVVVVAIAVIRPKLGSDSEAAPATTAAPVRTTVAASSTAPSTTAVPRPPGIGDALSVDGLSITPDAPLNGFGVLCLLVRLEGPPPLTFDRSKLAIVSGGEPIAVSGKVGTGRASLDDVPAGAGEAVREACFPVVDWNLRLTELIYLGQAESLTWTINDPAFDS